jgi:hypothetical protein
MTLPMGLPGRVLASITAAMMLAPVLLAAAGCSTKACAGQCGPPFQLQVVFRQGTSKQAAIAAMRKCQANPLVIRIGQPYRPRSGTPGQWTAVIYTKKMPLGSAHIPLLTCLHRSPAVTEASWPD